MPRSTGCGTLLHPFVALDILSYTPFRATIQVFDRENSPGSLTNYLKHIFCISIFTSESRGGHLCFDRAFQGKGEGMKLWHPTLLIWQLQRLGVRSRSDDKLSKSKYSTVFVFSILSFTYFWSYHSNVEDEEGFGLRALLYSVHCTVIQY